MITWYLTVRNDNTVADPFVADKFEPAEFDIWPLVSGQEVLRWDCPLILRASSADWDGEPDDVLQNALGLPIYSERLQRRLTAEGFGGIQYLPVHVLGPDSTEIPGFAIANVLLLVPCLDWSRSEYRLRRRKDREGECASITKLVLDRCALEGLDLFRMKEFRLNLIVSSRFKEAFESGGFTGYSFARVRTSGDVMS